MAARIVGSPDLYHTRGATASINFVTCHDGFTLADLVSYNDKHNEDNGEGNCDGANPRPKHPRASPSPDQKRARDAAGQPGRAHVAHVRIVRLPGSTGIWYRRTPNCSASAG
jgi:hypothetical protein